MVEKISKNIFVNVFQKIKNELIETTSFHIQIVSLILILLLNI